MQTECEQSDHHINTVTSFTINPYIIHNRTVDIILRVPATWYAYGMGLVRDSICLRNQNPNSTFFHMDDYNTRSSRQSIK